jgi:hypothetical protein
MKGRVIEGVRLIKSTIHLQVKHQDKTPLNNEHTLKH